MNSGTIVSLKNKKDFSKYVADKEAAAVEIELTKVKDQYNSWAENQRPEIFAFINNHLKHMNDDKERADFMAYIATVPNIEQLFQHVLLIDIAEYKPPAFSPVAVTVKESDSKDSNESKENSGCLQESDTSCDQISVEKETATFFIRDASKITSKKHLSPQEARFEKFQEWISAMDLDKRIEFNHWLMKTTQLEKMSVLLKEELHDKCPHKAQRAFLTWFDEELRALFDKYLALPVERNSEGALKTRKADEAANQKFRQDFKVWIDGDYAQAVKAAKNALTKETLVTYPALSDFMPAPIKGVVGLANACYTDSSDVDAMLAAVNPSEPIIAAAVAVGALVTDPSYATSKAALSVFTPAPITAILTAANAFFTAPGDAYATLNEFLLSVQIKSLIDVVNQRMRDMSTYFYSDTLEAMSHNSHISLENAYTQYTADSRFKTVQALFTNEESGLVLDVAGRISATDVVDVQPVAQAAGNPIVDATDLEIAPKQSNFRELLNDKNWFKLKIYLDKKAFYEKNPAITMLLNPTAADYDDRKQFLARKGLILSRKRDGKFEVTRANGNPAYCAFNVTNEAVSDFLTVDQLEFLKNWFQNCPTAVKNYINKNSCNFYTTVCIGWFGYAGELLYLGADFMIRIEGISILLKVFLGLSLNTSDEVFNNILNGVLTMYTATANLTFYPNADARNLMVKQAIHPNKSLFDLMIWKQVKERPWLALSFFCSSLAGALVDVLPLKLLKKYQAELGGKTGYQITFGLGSAAISISGVIYYTAYIYDGYNDSTDAGMKYFNKAWADAISADPEKRAIGQPLLAQMLITGIERVMRMGFGPWVFGDTLDFGSTASLSLAAWGSLSTIGTLPAMRFKKFGKYYDLSPAERKKGEEKYPKWREENFGQFLRAHMLDHSSFFTAAIAYAISEIFTMGMGWSGPLRAVAITIGCVLFGKLAHSFFAPLIYLNILKELAKSDNVHVPGMFVQASVGIDQVSRALGALSIGAALWSAGFTPDTPEGRLVIIFTFLIELGLSKANYLLQLDSTDEAVRGIVSEVAETGVYRWVKAAKDSASLAAMGCSQSVSKGAGRMLNGICHTARSERSVKEPETEIVTYQPMENNV